MFFVETELKFHQLEAKVKSAATREITSSGTISGQKSTLSSPRLAPILASLCATLLHVLGRCITLKSAKLTASKCLISLNRIPPLLQF
jgi:hypothetical protein